MQKIKQILSAFMAVVLFVSAYDLEVFADINKKPVISVESKNAHPGDTIDLDVSIVDNPGILGATLKLNYDEGLTMINATAGDAFAFMTMQKPGRFVSPCNFSWDGQDYTESDIKDGIIMHLTFKIDADVPSGKVMNINLSADEEDIYNNNLDKVDVDFKSGTIVATTYTPGDVNADNKINATDVVLMRRHIVGGYDVEIDEDAANVNDDGKVNSMDVTIVRRYIAGGYDVRLKPVTVKYCKHEKINTAYKAATCVEDGNVEYWYCVTCGKYFADANGKNEIDLNDTIIPAMGHVPVIDPAVEPTLLKPGLTEGSHCAVCKTVIIPQQEWKSNTYSIRYDIANGDTYLSSLVIKNENPTVISEGGSMVLSPLEVEGYRFLGWYDLSVGGNLVQKIEKADRNMNLYAHWEKIEYIVQFESNILDVSDKAMTYTSGTGKILPNLSLDGYTFCGWSDDNGKIVTRIKPGSKGDITLHANWLSDRNQAWTKKTLDKPIIIEDSESNVMLFVYEIGEVKNVPLSLIHNFGKINESGVPLTVTAKYTTTTSKAMMDSYVKTIEKATTDSSSWTLSKEWSDSTTVNKEYCEENKITEEEAKTIGQTESGEWYVSNCSGGSHSTSTVDTTDIYDLNTQNKSTGTNSSTSYYKSETLDIKGGINAGPNWLGLKGEIDKSSSNGNQSTGSSSRENVEGNQGGTLEHHTSDTSDTSTWNSESGYKTSNTTSSSETIATAISQAISEKTGYGNTYINTGGESSEQGFSSSNKSSDEYSTSVTYSTSESQEYEVSFTTSNTKEGYHRWVVAGTAHVFGVVGYDIATKSYFTYTMSLMDDENHRFEDYSYNTASFDDNQNSVIPFVVPYNEINDYVRERVFATDGLEVDLDGNITGYNGTDSYVIIPDYMTVDNYDSGKKTVVKITGITSDAFRGNRNITGIELSNYITKIPDNAFENCEKLWKFVGFNIEEIGNNAFKGAIQLDQWNIGSNLIRLGENALDKPYSLNINAANAGIVKSATSSEAKNITIDMAHMVDSLDNEELIVTDATDSYALNGYGKEFSNLTIKSDADSTKINRVNIKADKGIPLQFTSDAVMLYQSNIESKGICATLLADNTNLDLYGQVNLTTAGANSILCKDATVAQANRGLATKMNLQGDLITCGTVLDNNFINGRIVKVTSDEFNKLLNSYQLSFDANGGECDEAYREVAVATPIGDLPVPTKEGYDFDGWYTSDDIKVSKNDIFSTGSDITLYAHWNVKEYTANWNEGTGFTIEVSRDASPYANATIGILNSGDNIYYGDEITIKYVNKEGFSIEEKGEEVITVDGNITSAKIFASVTPMIYTVDWEEPEGCNITVERTSSPYKKADVGEINCGDDIYYGDVLKVNYNASTGYSLTDRGLNEIQVIGNVSTESIYASAKPNSYSYRVVYKSSNGTDLGSTTVTKVFGTTETISAPGKTGYNTPAAQSVKWDSTDVKTITFIYTPASKSNKQLMSSGHMDYWTTSSGRPSGIYYDAYAEFQNRTANSVQIRVTYTNKCYAYTTFGYGQWFTPTINGQNCGETQIASNSTWSGSYVTYDRTATASSGWVTVSVSPTTTSVGVSSSWRTANSKSGSWNGNITIPTY